MSARSKTDAEVIRHIESKCARAESGCLEWGGNINRYGYGRATHQYKHYHAHRLLWIAARGPIPPGMQALHKCDNRKCCNLDHIFIGTIAANMTDKTEKGRQAKGVSHGQHKLIPEQVIEIREKYRAGGHTQRSLARDYMVNQGLIHLIVNRRIWRHVPELENV